MSELSQGAHLAYATATAENPTEAVGAALNPTTTGLVQAHEQGGRRHGLSVTLVHARPICYIPSSNAALANRVLFAVVAEVVDALA